MAFDEHTAKKWATDNLKLERSQYSASLDEVAWNTCDKYSDGIKFVAQYVCGGDGRNVFVTFDKITLMKKRNG